MLSTTDPASRRSPPSRRGLSLIELMIVVVILGALVAIVIPSFNVSESNAKDDVVVAEMRQLRQAFCSFYTDNYPDASAVADIADYGLWPLFSTNDPPAGLNATLASYDPANRLGWRGPYALMEKSGQPVHLANGQPQDSAEGGSGPTAEIPVILDPYGGYYRVMLPDGASADLYLVCTGPDRKLQTAPSSTNGFGRLVAAHDDSVLPLLNP
jgi:prepilin-type N-terminal cleavage/methylation domain-containing protein